MRSRARASLTAPVARGCLLVCLAVAAGCGGGKTDREDEMGTADGGAGGYELVIVDEGVARPEAAGESAVPADTARLAGAAAPAAPVPVPADTGGVVEYDPRGEYTVQVGMFAEAGQAAAEVRRLRGSGYPAYALTVPAGGGVRVRIGYFRSRVEAERFGRRFQADTGTAFWVDRRASEAH